MTAHDPAIRLDSVIDFPFAEPSVQLADEPEPAAIIVETWQEFSAKAGEHVPVLVEGLWPEQALGFIAAPPKKGKTWIALALAVGIATGHPYLGRFRIPQPRNVLYVALEGHRAAIRGRVGAITHGLGLDPDSDDLHRLHWAYKPRGLNISDPGWAKALQTAAAEVDAALVIVDVLRAAARMKENPTEDFMILRHNLLPIMADGRSIALLHHFGKLTELTKERSPGERMSGTGAMYGAMDIGIFITASENGAKNLKVEIESRDLATPERLGVHLRGEGTGEHGGYVYHDKATFDCDDDAPQERDLKATAEEIRDYVLEQGGDVEVKFVRAYFDIVDKTVTRRLGKLMQLGIDYVGGRGKPGRLVVHTDNPEPPQTHLEVPTSDTNPKVRTTELPNFAAQQSQNGGVPTSSDITPMSELESGDLQGKSKFGHSDSPTERYTAPDGADLSGEPDMREPEPFDTATAEHEPARAETPW